MFNSTAIGHIGKIDSHTFEVDGSNGQKEQRQLTLVQLAVDRNYKDKQNNKITDWATIKCWNGLGKTVAEHLQVGRLVAFTIGGMETRMYDKEVEVTIEGKKYIIKVPTKVTEFVADNFKFLDGPKDKSAGSNGVTVTAVEDAPTGQATPPQTSSNVAAAGTAAGTDQVVKDAPF